MKKIAEPWPFVPLYSILFGAKLHTHTHISSKLILKMSFTNHNKTHKAAILYSLYLRLILLLPKKIYISKMLPPSILIHYTSTSTGTRCLLYLKKEKFVSKRKQYIYYCCPNIIWWWWLKVKIYVKAISWTLFIQFLVFQFNCKYQGK